MPISTKLHYFLLIAIAFADGKLVEHTFSIHYFPGYPDGVASHFILGINGRFPGPTIEATVGDTIKVTVYNHIYDRQNTTLHWHGILQWGTPFEDGPAHITQCPLKYGRKQVYKFVVDQPGTYWYHSHVGSQYTEGTWGVLIVHNMPEVYAALYDDEFTVALSDWYHHRAIKNEEHLLSPDSEGAPPFPSSILMNGFGRFPCANATAANRTCNPDLQMRPVFRVTPGLTYRLRLLNTAGWTAFNFTVEGHLLKTIEVDGVDVEVSDPVQAVYIAAGQRYSFLLSIPRREGVAGNKFLIRASFRREFLFQRPSQNINRDPEATFPEVSAVLEYVSEPTTIQAVEKFSDSDSYTVSEENQFINLSFLNDQLLVPADGWLPPNYFNGSFTLNIGFAKDDKGIVRGSFNNFPAVLPTGKPLLAKFVNMEELENCMPLFNISHGKIIQVVINNPMEGPHPVHLHGHHFYVMGAGQSGEGDYAGQTFDNVRLRRDTATVKQGSWLVIRFLADSPGIWTFHCHIDWHLAMGMMGAFVESWELAHTLSTPEEARRVCMDHGIII